MTDGADPKHVTRREALAGGAGLVTLDLFDISWADILGIETESNSGATPSSLTVTSDGEVVATKVETLDIGQYLTATQTGNGVQLVSASGSGSLTKLRDAGAFGSVQAAVDDIPIGSGDNTLGKCGLGEVYVPAKDPGWNEAVVNIPQAIVLRGQGINTRIYTTGSHTLSGFGSDADVRDLWVDQEDSSGSYDAVHADNDELGFRNLDIDFAPRYALWTDHQRITGQDIQIQGGKTAGLYLGSNAKKCTFTDVIVQSGGFGSGVGTGVVIDGNHNEIEARVTGTNDHGVFIGGSKNTVTVNADSCTNDELRVDGNNNAIDGVIAGDVTFLSGTSGNSLSGVVTGTITDNGSNDTTGVA